MLGIGAEWGQAVVEPATEAVAKGRVRVDVLNPFGAPMPTARVRVLRRDRVFASGEELELPVGTYRLEVVLPWYRMEKEVRVALGDTHVLFAVPFLTVTDLPRVTLELRFVDLPAGCSLGYLQMPADGEAVRVPIRVVGDRVAAGPLQLGFYAVTLLGEKGVCGVGGFFAEKAGVPVRVVIAPIGGR